MPNDLAPMWTPPESKTMSAVMKYGTMAAIAGGGVYAFTQFAPTMIDAVTLADTLLQDGTHMLISGGLLVGTCWFLYETLSPAGHINRLLRLPYWLLINGLTRFFITIDPLSPIDERIKSVRADKEDVDKNVEKLSGIVSNLREQEESFRAQSADAQKRGIAAHSRHLQDLEDVQAHNFGTFRDTADDLGKLRGKIEPALETLEQVSRSCDVMVQKLTTERAAFKAKWDAQIGVANAMRSASRVLGRSRTQVWDMAEQAASIINDRYGEELGHLEHLKSVTKPLMESIDLDNATYSEEMLAQVTTTGAKLIQATGDPLPAEAHIPSPTSDILAGFIH